MMNFIKERLLFKRYNSHFYLYDKGDILKNNLKLFTSFLIGLPLTIVSCILIGSLSVPISFINNEIGMIIAGYSFFGIFILIPVVSTMIYLFSTKVFEEIGKNLLSHLVLLVYIIPLGLNAYIGREWADTYSLLCIIPIILLITIPIVRYILISRKNITLHTYIYEEPEEKAEYMKKYSNPSFQNVAYNNIIFTLAVLGKYITLLVVRFVLVFFGELLENIMSIDWIFNVESILETLLGIGFIIYICKKRKKFEEDKYKFISLIMPVIVLINLVFSFVFSVSILEFNIVYIVVEVVYIVFITKKIIEFIKEE